MRKASLQQAFLLSFVTILCFAACGKKEAPKEEPAKDTAPETAGAPKIVAVNDTFNFGQVKQGAVAEHIFKIRNEGTADLTIKRAKGS